MVVASYVAVATLAACLDFVKFVERSAVVE